MVFSSPPLYLDPPNWHQQSNQHGASSSDHDQNLFHHHLLQQTPPPPPPTAAGGAGNSGSSQARPGSMVERARLAKLPQPETALKCPRCDSSNTKFCYFNNYSLTQPRHFCKTCRRYWTRGGALRNVPVGGGCRRNKRSKSRNGRSKSPSAAASAASTASADIPTHLPPQPAIPFHLPPLSHVTDYGEIGMNFGGLQPPLGIVGSGMLPEEQWRIQQHFPYFSTGFMEPSYVGNGVSQLGSKPQLESGGVTQQMATVKLEDNNNNNHNNNNGGLGLLGSSPSSRNFLGMNNLAGGGGGGNSDQYSWAGAGNPWSTNDLSGFASSSSTAHLL